MYGLGRKLLNHVERAKIVELYTRSLMTQAAIARRFGTTSHTVYEVLKQAGVKKVNRSLTVT
jgi:transposase-like protein